MNYDMSNWDYDEDPAEDPDFDLDDDPEEIVKECSYCKGTGISRDVEADCLKCWGEGYI